MTSSSSSSQVSVINWFHQFIIIAYMALAIMVLTAGVFLAIGWLRTPFIGGFVDQRLVFNGLEPLVRGTWSAVNQGIRSGDQLLDIQGMPVSSTNGIQEILKDLKAGQSITLSVLRTGQRLELQVDLASLPVNDQVGFLAIPFFIALIFLASGLWTFVLHRFAASARVFAVFVTSVAISTGVMFDAYTTHAFTYVWTATIALAGGSIVHLAMIFPTEDRLVTRFRWLPYSGYIPAIALIINAFVQLSEPANPTGYLSAWEAEGIFTGLAVGFFLVWTAIRRFTRTSPIEREQARTILLGAIFAVVPLAIWILFTFFRLGIPFFPYVLLPLAVFPLSTGYTFQRSRLLKTNYILSRLGLYSLLAILTAGGYALLVTGLNLVLVNIVAPNHPLVVGGVTFLFALAIIPARDRLRMVIDRVFFRGERTYQERIQAFSHNLTNAVNLAGITKTLQTGHRTNLDARSIPCLYLRSFQRPLSCLNR